MRAIWSLHSDSNTETLEVKFRAFFGSIPEDFGNRVESTITRLPMRNKQWQKHHNTTSRRIEWRWFCFFYEVGTAVWPRQFYRFFSKENSGGKTPVAIPRFLLRQKNKASPFDSPWFGVSCGDFAIVYFSLVTSLWLIHRDSRNLRELTRRNPWSNWILGVSLGFLTQCRKICQV